MNEKIVIIGNGFDLRHCLPTGYNHLMSVLEEIENYSFENENILIFSDLFDNIFKTNNKVFYEHILEYYDAEKKINFDAEKLFGIKERIKKNQWFQYFKSVGKNKIETWIDFETEVNRVLDLVTNFNLNYKDYIVVDPDSGLPRVDYYKGENQLKFNILKNFGFLIDLFDDLNPGINLDNLIISSEFGLKINGILQYIKEKEFYDHLYKQLENFIGIFNDYIIYVINPFYVAFKNHKEENFIKKNGIFLFDKVHRVLSFNYTDTYMKFYKEGERNKFLKNDISTKYDFIHGMSKSDWNKLEDLKIVLGVSDITDNLKKHKLFQFTKYFQKLHKETDYMFLNEMVKNVKRNNNISKDIYNNTFYFWGHSLDSSDSDYIKEVFFIVENTESTICIFYHSISGKADQLKNLLDIIHKDKIEYLMKEKN